MKMEFKEAIASAYSKIEEKLEGIVIEKEMEELKNFQELTGETGIEDLKEDLVETWKQEECEASIGEFAF